MTQEWIVDVLTTSRPIPLVLAVVFVYAFLLAVLLPFPAELALVAALSLDLPRYLAIGAVMVVAAAGSAFGSLLAQRLGYGVSRSDPVTRVLGSIPGYSRFRRHSLVTFVQKYRYVGLTITLSIPLLPVTATLYAFSTLEENPKWFAVTVFFATFLRLTVFLMLIYGGIYVLDEPVVRELV